MYLATRGDFLKIYAHHLYPRYLNKAGKVPSWGDKDIVIPVTHVQHIMFHWCNYQLWGNFEDKVAYDTMRGTEDGASPSQLGNLAFQRLLSENEEFRSDFCSKMKINSELGCKAIRKKLLTDPSFRQERMNHYRHGAELANAVIKEMASSDPEYRARRSAWSSKGSAGKVWITNGEINSKIPSGSALPEGFRLGRTQYWNNP